MGWGSVSSWLSDFAAAAGKALRSKHLPGSSGRRESRRTHPRRPARGALQFRRRTTLGQGSRPKRTTPSEVARLPQHGSSSDLIPLELRCDSRAELIVLAQDFGDKLTAQPRYSSDACPDLLQPPDLRRVWRASCRRDDKAQWVNDNVRLQNEN